jgi:hypothetical protein
MRPFLTGGHCYAITVSLRAARRHSITHDKNALVLRVFDLKPTDFILEEKRNASEIRVSANAANFGIIQQLRGDASAVEEEMTKYKQ